jgi:glycine cleavage system H protein
MEPSMSTPDSLKYTERHVWVRRESDGTASVGITHHAQEQLGDVVFVESPLPGRRLKPDEACGVIESVKTASDIHAPVSGEVVAVNPELADAPEKVNADAYAAWLFRLKPDQDSDIDALLDAAAYRDIAGIGG